MRERLTDRLSLPREGALHGGGPGVAEEDSEGEARPALAVPGAPEGSGDIPLYYPANTLGIEVKPRVKVVAEVYPNLAGPSMTWTRSWARLATPYWLSGLVRRRSRR